VGCKTK